MQPTQKAVRLICSVPGDWYRRDYAIKNHYK
jgi:hypothetical protein